MKDDYEDTMRRLIADAEADIGFDRDAPEGRATRRPPTRAAGDLLALMAAAGIALMRAMWWPNHRRH